MPADEATLSPRQYSEMATSESSQVYLQVENLEKRARALEELKDALFGALSPVLTPVESDDNEPRAEIREVVCPLAGRLQDVHDSYRSLEDSLRGLTERIRV